MSFWNSMIEILGQIESAAERKNQEIRGQIDREQWRMQNHSVSELKDKAVNGTVCERAVAIKTLEGKGIVPRKSQTAGSIKGSASGKTSLAYRKGDSKTVKTTIVLSAPGRKEEKAGRPAAGQTGVTLQAFIEELHRTDPSKFPSDRLDDYTIVNAVEDVHYIEKTGRTEGYDFEVCDSSNIGRVQNALKGSENVIALGDKAQLVVEKAEFKGNVLRGDHPSMQALNRKYQSEAETPAARHRDRVKQWADDIEKLDNSNGGGSE